MSEGRARPLGTALAAGVAACAGLGLVVQFRVSLGLVEADGGGVLATLGVMSSYFTILTNVLVAVALGWPLLRPGSRTARWLAAPAVQAGVTLAILLVGLGYNVLLRWTWAPVGWARVADELLHTVVPLGTLVAFLVSVRPGALRWRHLPRWCLYPLGYLALALVRGALTGVYPYWFLDPGLLGWARLAASATVLMLVLVGLGAALIAVDRRRARRSAPASD